MGVTSTKIEQRGAKRVLKMYWAIGVTHAFIGVPILPINFLFPAIRFHLKADKFHFLRHTCKHQLFYDL